MPLYIILLGGLLGGFIIGATAAWLSEGKNRKEKRTLKKQVKALEKQLDDAQGALSKNDLLRATCSRLLQPKNKIQTMTKPIIFCAIDTGDLDHAKQLAHDIGGITGGIKLGLEFFNSFGPNGIEAVASSAPEAALFVDLKYHDIPNTVAGAVRSICKRVQPAYLNVPPQAAD